MSVEISVGPSVLAINQGSTFMVTELSGEIAADGEQGLFASDTRFVSYYAISANGEPWTRLTSSTPIYYGARIHLSNGDLITEDIPIEAGTISLTISRGVAEGVHEDLDLVNYSRNPTRFNLEIAMRSDFADLFEVKSHRFVRRGRMKPGGTRMLASCEPPTATWISTVRSFTGSVLTAVLITLMDESLSR
jgi:N-terminal domain of (some) glycogen debranching enzymes